MTSRLAVGSTRAAAGPKTLATSAIVPPGVKDGPAGLRLLNADNIGGALRVLREIADNKG